MAVVYRFRSWDIHNDQYQPSHRWATRERIEKLCGEITSEGVEVSDQYIGREIEGMTDRNFDPRHLPRKDFGR